MGSGRHGAARPPIGVLIHRDRVDFSIYGLQAAVTLVIMVLTGPASPVFWLCFLLLFGGVVLFFRRIDRLAREELAESDLL
ncbi:hypothetical protein JCM3263A_05100 [Thermobifida fusca]|jgi:hypothetical protein|uniref:Uncharacterized protein n=2 Tax=Thermobifida fusca TaxID=2021 RepID=A0A9P2WS77_THEFU|nr:MULTISPECIES: hypothetical protein [Thermobifida]AAZ54554.1 hypothetical protein Tfu_0516 [Thermobifida fusca YX]EOR72393.1 hypothetical protein TM51_02943 [Thermobifida fusca TM51]MBO2529583.1 hypothetical protein [Thermobifida sp.]MDD6793286.1 hypothetical protein [Thermobifida fusca]PPS93401.1 hypothetical protein BH05_07910 [Thermobifida fusca]